MIQGIGRMFTWSPRFTVRDPKHVCRLKTNVLMTAGASISNIVMTHMTNLDEMVIGMQYLVRISVHPTPIQ
jgi:hypothetical protein